MSLCGEIMISLIVTAVLCATLPVYVYADTDGTEIQITERPERLTVQLGRQWAGVEFQLKTDNGLFPIPVVVNQSGILQMDLGGSKTYVLSCLSSAVAVPEPTQTINTPLPSISPVSPVENSGEVEIGKVRAGMSLGSVILLVVCFTAAAAGLIELWYFIRRKKSVSLDTENDDD